MSASWTRLSPLKFGMSQSAICRERLPGVLLRLAQRPLRHEGGSSRHVDEVERVPVVVRHRLQRQLEERLGLVRTALEHEAEPETCRPGREEALLAELPRGHRTPRAAQPRPQAGLPRGARCRSAPANTRPRQSEVPSSSSIADAFLPAPARLVEATREREERTLLDAGDRLDLPRRGLLENVAAARQRLVEPGVGPYQLLTRNQFRICASSRPLRARRAQARPRANASSPDFPCQKLSEPEPETTHGRARDRRRAARGRQSPSGPARRTRRFRLVQPQLRGDEAHTRPPLDHLLACSRCLVDDLDEDRLGLASARPARPARRPARPAPLAALDPPSGSGPTPARAA